MLWIKRNLFLVVFGAAALALLVGGILYLMSSHAKNTDIEEQVSKARSELDGLRNSKPYPNATNIAVARRELERVRTAVTNAKAFFKAVPVEMVTNQQPFKTLLNKTIFDLQQSARKAGVELPKPDYAFSFEAQQKQLTAFAPGSFPSLPEQLAEVKTICDVLFESGINRLVTVRRSRVTIDDPPERVSDYHDMPGNQTNLVTGTVGNPYEVNFHAFSPELAAVLDGFARSPYGMTVKWISVDPVIVDRTDSAFVPPPPPSVTQPQQPVRPLPTPNRPTVGRPPGNPPSSGATTAARPQPARPGTASTTTRETLVPVINERLLNVTLRMEIIRSVK